MNMEFIACTITIVSLIVLYVTTTFHILSARHNPRHKPMTNGDRIRAMTDEELAAVMVKGDLHFCTIAETDCIYGWHTPNCIAHALKWLQQPVKEDAR